MADRRDHGPYREGRERGYRGYDPEWDDREAEVREAERQYRLDQEARRRWQEDYRPVSDRRRYEDAWTPAGRYHPYFGEPRVWGDPFNIEPGYPRYWHGYDDPRRRPREHGRGWLDRTSDEVMSWFGDEAAERRREHDREGLHRGRGPRGYTRSDARISDDVHDRLTDDPYLDASEIQIRVENGEVTLDGLVDSRFAKRRAEDLVDSVSGTKHCQNNLRVRPASETRDELPRTATAAGAPEAAPGPRH